MALGFIKKVFTFGKDKPAADKPAESEAFANLVDDAEKVDAGETIEALPEAADPVAPEVIGTAGGPAADEAGAEPEASPPSGPSDHLPLKGGDRTDTAGISSGSDKEPARTEDAQPASTTVAESSGRPAPDPVIERVAGADRAPISPLEGEMSGRTEGGTTHSETEDDQSGDPVAARTAENPIEAPVQPVDIALPKGFATTASRPEPEPETPAVKLSWFQRLRQGLARTSSQLTGQIAALFTKRKLDEDTLEELEDLLIQADLGVETAMRVTGTLSSERYGKDVTGEDVSRIMAAEITKVLKPVAKPLALDLSHKPHVILVVGVNGTGKTTTIGKLAAKLSGSGLKVMLAAGDTFRAAAIEQLKIWADRTGSTFLGTKLGADAAGLAYDAFEKARADKADVLIIDTAGRLQNKTELMAELEKIVRVLGKLDPDAPHTVLQTLDATTGQNAMNQVEIFRNIAGVNGLIMTKLDGTARGGILVAIAAKHKLPVYFIGVGEGIDDLEPFEAEDFANAIAGLPH
ncbi:signal recognition particle-docking protein FtsY [Rhizobium sp. KAs_5_22]|uniref:signal recognition particle-docking protein FtsY n=1 Tax=Ciceribacter selenitireducens TaxID=448181 RepID=UPI00048C7DE7|nr:signal recognition particle-docking protein FtsY [Ciceribacter selenitireducens]PPJ45077.1 signal recognition particle-docking protein FtsY [Rhizobium sp. KAs_5_22]